MAIPHEEMQKGRPKMRRVRREVLDSLVGSVAVFTSVLGIYFASQTVAREVFSEEPNASVALSAWFEPDASVVSSLPPPSPQRTFVAKEIRGSGLRIVGQVQRGEAPVHQGRVKITVEKWRGGFRQSINTVLRADGSFQSFDNPAFRELKGGDSLVLDAEVWTSTIGSKPLTERIYLNSPVPTWIRKTTVYPFIAFLLISLAVFLWVFTGPNNARKNRAAIMFSYLVIFISLLCAFLAPVLFVQAIPFNQDLSESTPVGIVMARLTENSPPEWMLNIGGIVDRELEKASRASQTQPDGLREAGIQKEGTGRLEEKVGRVETEAERDAETIPVVKEDAPLSPIVRLRGGIQVPLYVLILSVVGGAINMARQVPKYQGQQPESGPLISSVGATIRSIPKRIAAALSTEEERPVEGREEGEESSSSAESKSTETHGAVAAEPAAVPSVRTQETPWRIGLLDQYMFLVSAPFLGIATYYLLLWLDFTQTPVIVLVSFSIGLTSDLIIGAITGTASSFLNRNNSNGNAQV